MAPASPRVLRMLAIGLLGGIGLGVGLAWLLELLDRRLRTSDDVSELRLPLIASLPVAPTRLARSAPPMEQRLLAGLPPPSRTA